MMLTKKGKLSVHKRKPVKNRNRHERLRTFASFDMARASENALKGMEFFKGGEALAIGNALSALASARRWFKK